jgi:hypothetical protein
MAVSVHLLHRLPMVSRGAAPVDAEAIGGTKVAGGMEEAGGPDRRANRAAKHLSLHPRARFEYCVYMVSWLR